MTFTHAVATNNYGPQKFIVSASAANGTHTTIGAAMTAASSGDSIFIRAGTYTENVTHKAGVSVTGDAGVFDAIVTGKWQISGAGVFDISNITLTTNGDFCLVIGGSAATIVHLNGVFINAFDNTGISFTTSNGAAVIAAQNCVLGTTGTEALFANSSIGSFEIYNCVTAGNTTTASTISAGTVDFFNSTISIPFATSSTGSMSMTNCRLDTGFQNSICITTAGTGSVAILNSELRAGSAACLSIGAGTVAIVSHCPINSTATNTLTGAGTLQYAYLSFPNTSSGHNVTTETALAQLT